MVTTRQMEKSDNIRPLLDVVGKIKIVLGFKVM